MDHIHVPVPPRRPTGEMRFSKCALRSAPDVLKPQYIDACVVVRNCGCISDSSPSRRRLDDYCSHSVRRDPSNALSAVEASSSRLSVDINRSIPRRSREFEPKKKFALDPPSTTRMSKNT